MKRGDRAVLFNGRGREITAEIVDLSRSEIRLRKVHETETAPLRCRITLGQAIPKGRNMDLIVQKAVEIGAAEIAPLISERTIVDLDKKEAEQKCAKWQQIAIEAAKQCGQNWLPTVQTPRKLKDFFRDVETGVSPVILESMRPTRAPLHLFLSLKNALPHFVKHCEDLMRGIIVKTISVEDVQALRHLQAVEGYVDLGMFEEAEDELRALDPAWFALEETLSLQLRVLAGLSPCE